MKKAFYYLYVITNLTTRRKYIGQHCTYYLNDGYTGSNKELNEAIANGDKFKIRILKFFDNIFDLGYAERDLILLLKADRNPKYYNKDHRLYFNHCFERNSKVIAAISKGVKKAINNHTKEEKIKINKNKSLGSRNSIKIKQNKFNHMIDKIIHPNVIMSASDQLDEFNYRNNISLKHKGKKVKQSSIDKLKKTRKERGINYRGENNPMFGKGYKIAGEKNGSYGKGNSKGSHWKTKLYPKPCIYCGKITTLSAISRFHNENCKHKSNKCE